MDRVLEILRSEVAADKVRVDNPTQNLESYFLDVVERARGSATQTSGATSGNRVAAYLQGSGESTLRQADKILDRFAKPSPALVSDAAPATEALPASRAPVDSRRLEALTPEATRLPKPGSPTPRPGEEQPAGQQLACIAPVPRDNILACSEFRPQLVGNVLARLAENFLQGFVALGSIRQRGEIAGHHVP